MTVSFKEKNAGKFFIDKEDEERANEDGRRRRRNDRRDGFAMF